MDSSPLLKSFLSIALSLLLAATPLYAASADTQTAGEVKALIPEASRNAQPVNAKDSLNWNDLLKTGAQGRLRAGLTAGSILSLGSNSELQVVQHDAVSQQTSLVVNYGKLRNQVNKITKPDGKYEVRTPNAVIGVIGTDFYVGYENRQTTVICYTGKVVVTPASGAKVVKGDNKKKESAAHHPSCGPDGGHRRRHPARRVRRNVDSRAGGRGGHTGHQRSRSAGEREQCTSPAAKSFDPHNNGWWIGTGVGVRGFFGRWQSQWQQQHWQPANQSN